MRLNGQNLRVLVNVGGNFQCIAMSTNCRITMTGNTENNETKDDVGMASKPTIVSKAWSVQVDSLDVTDAKAMLTAIKSLTPFTLMWDETSTTDNQTGLTAEFQRIGQAFINDLTLTYDDRTMATKNIQFTGTGGIERDTQVQYNTVEGGGYTRGQYVRLFLSSDDTTAPSDVIAAGRNLSLHVSLNIESATTKDTTGDWEVQEATGLSYDISVGSLVRSSDTVTSLVGGKDLADLEDIYKNSEPVKWEIANVSGANNRTKGASIVSGSVVLTQLEITAAVRNAATYTAQLQGYGAYNVAS